MVRYYLHIMINSLIFRRGCRGKSKNHYQVSVGLWDGYLSHWHERIRYDARLLQVACSILEWSTSRKAAAKPQEVEEEEEEDSEELEDDVDSVTVQELKDYLLKDKGKLFNTKLLKIIFFIYSCIY